MEHVLYFGRDTDRHIRLRSWLESDDSAGWRYCGSVSRSDGYIFHVFRKRASIRVTAGCRVNRGLAWWRTHIKQYSTPLKRAETRAIIDQCERLAKKCKY